MATGVFFYYSKLCQVLMYKYVQKQEKAWNISISSSPAIHYIIKTEIPESKLLNRAIATRKSRSKSRKLIVKNPRGKLALSKNFLSDI